MTGLYGYQRNLRYEHLNLYAVQRHFVLSQRSTVCTRDRYDGTCREEKEINRRWVRDGLNNPTRPLSGRVVH